MGRAPHRANRRPDLAGPRLVVQPRGLLIVTPAGLDAGILATAATKRKGGVLTPIGLKELSRARPMFYGTLVRYVAYGFEASASQAKFSVLTKHVAEPDPRLAAAATTAG